MTAAAEVTPDVLTDSTAGPQCEASFQCPDQCTPPVRCTDPAAVRVTFRCSTPGCTKATHVMLLCRYCGAHADAIGTVLARRPL